MTTIDTRSTAQTVHGDATATDAASAIASVDSWLTTTDHKRIGRMFTGCGLLMLFTVAVVGVIAGLERANGTTNLVKQGAVLQLMQSYRVGLVMAGIAPLCLGLAIAVAPLQVGSRQIAYPRVALVGFYGWIGGLVLLIAALINNGGFGGGNADAFDLFLAADGLMILGLLAGAGSVATTVLTSRAPGMSMWRVPFFAWSALIMALGMLLALPVAFGLTIYLFVDHRLGVGGNFHGASGSGVVLAWAFSVPMVIVYAMPAFGLMAELMPVVFRRRPKMRGAQFGAIALTGISVALAAATQQTIFSVTFKTSFSTFLKGAVPYAIFAGLPVLGGLMLFGLCANAAKPNRSAGGSSAPNISAAFLFAFFGFGMVFIGIVGYAMQAISDLNLVGTVFEEGAVLFVVYGAALSAVGGLIFWAPKLTGRTVGASASLLALIGVLGVLAAGFPLYIAGFLGEPGGLPTNPADVAALTSLGGVSSIWMLISVVGQALVGLTLLATLAATLKSTKSADAGLANNPSGGQTIEWTTTSPAPGFNFEYVPTVASPTPAFDLTAEGSRA